MAATPLIQLEADDLAQWQHWFAAAKQPTIDQAIGDLYAEIDAAISAKGPTCWTSGKCCKFNSFGHLLYVTALEITRFLNSLPPNPTQVSSIASEGSDMSGIKLPIAPSSPASSKTSATLPDACRYQVEGMCSVHTVRPLGCRIFFCQQGTQAWQQDLYEQFHQQMQDLHSQFELPYRYLEWRAGLIEADQAKEILTTGK